MHKLDLSADRVRHLFDYCAESGVVTRKVTVGRRGMVGQVVGCLTRKGYLCVRIDGNFYMLHRVIFLHMTGRWPRYQIDHANGAKSDNRWANLREATQAQNSQNVKPHVDSSSGKLGVSWHKEHQKWRASIGINGRHEHLGYFTAKEEAQLAYVAAKKSMHPFQPTLRS